VVKIVIRKVEIYIKNIRICMYLEEIYHKCMEM